MSAETARSVRNWLERYGLSDIEGARALALGNEDVIMREYKSNKREPAAPTLRLIKVTVHLLEGLTLMQGGRILDARIELEKALTTGLYAALLRRTGRQDLI